MWKIKEKVSLDFLSQSWCQFLVLLQEPLIRANERSDNIYNLNQYIINCGEDYIKSKNDNRKRFNYRTEIIDNKILIYDNLRDKDKCMFEFIKL